VAAVAVVVAAVAAVDERSRGYRDGQLRESFRSHELGEGELRGASADWAWIGCKEFKPVI